MRYLRWSVPLLIGVLAAAGAPVALGAQGNLSQVVDDWEGRYEVARDNYQAAYQEWEYYESRWQQLMEEFGRTQAAEDERRITEILAQLQDLSQERDRAEGALRIRKDEWHDASEGLISALEARIELQVQQMERSPVGSNPDLLAVYNLYSARLDEVESETTTQLGPRRELELPPMPDLQIQPDDTRREVEFKIRNLQSKITVLEDLSSELDGEIAQLEKRQRWERTRDDLYAGVTGFDDVVVPVMPRSGATAAVGDTTAVDLALEPLETRIARLTGLRDSVLERIEQLQQKVEDFQREAERRP
ncbi:MAG: hypothetical protein OXN18_09055 [Gemmatimonadota bacterium]|nr:hypothetical protein [Gemmatimonadota bacterium]